MKTNKFETVLSTRAKNLLLYNTRLKKMIADAVGKSEGTVHRWIQHDETLITQADAMEIIRRELGLPDEDLLMKVEKKEKAA